MKANQTTTTSKLQRTWVNMTVFIANLKTLNVCLFCLLKAKKFDSLHAFVLINLELKFHLTLRRSVVTLFYLAFLQYFAFSIFLFCIRCHGSDNN